MDGRISFADEQKRLQAYILLIATDWCRKGVYCTFNFQATTGKIHFVRERTVASQERELEVNQKLFKCVLWSEIYDLSTKLIHTLLSGGAQGSG